MTSLAFLVSRYLTSHVSRPWVLLPFLSSRIRLPAEICFASAVIPNPRFLRMRDLGLALDRPDSSPALAGGFGMTSTAFPSHESRSTAPELQAGPNSFSLVALSGHTGSRLNLTNPAGRSINSGTAETMAGRYRKGDERESSRSMARQRGGSAAGRSPREGAVKTTLEQDPKPFKG